MELLGEEEEEEEGCLQKMTMLVKSSGMGGEVFDVVARDVAVAGPVGLTGGSSRKMRQVGKMEKTVRMTWEAAGRERSPA